MSIRVAGVNIPESKRLEVALTYVYGLGGAKAKDLCKRAGISPNKRTKDLRDDEVAAIRTLIEQTCVVEGDLRREVSLNIKRLVDMGCYRGVRHRKKLPVRGQRTHTNARTRKGKSTGPIAGKKKATKK